MYLHNGGAANCGGPICLSMLAGRQAADKEGLDRLFNSGIIFPPPTANQDVDKNEKQEEQEKNGTDGEGDSDAQKKREKESPDPTNNKNPGDADKPLEEGAAKPEADGKMLQQSDSDKNSHNKQTKTPFKPFYAACWSTGFNEEMFDKVNERWWSSSSDNLSAFCWETAPRKSGQTVDWVDNSSAFIKNSNFSQYPNYFLNLEYYNHEENRKKDIRYGLEQELIEQDIGKTIAEKKSFLKNINRPEVKVIKEILEPVCKNNTLCQAGMTIFDSLGKSIVDPSDKKFVDIRSSQIAEEKISEIERRQQNFERAQKSSPYIFESDNRFREHHRKEGEAVQRDKSKMAAWGKRGFSERLKQERQNSIVSYNETLPPMEYSPELYKDTPHIYRNLPKLLQEPASEALLMVGSLYVARTGLVGTAVALGVNYARDKTIEVMNNRVANDEEHNVLVDRRRAAAMYIALDRMCRERQKSSQASEPATESLKQSISSISEASAGSEVIPSKVVRDTTDLSFSSLPPQEQRNPTGARP